MEHFHAFGLAINIVATAARKSRRSGHDHPARKEREGEGLSEMF